MTTKAHKGAAAPAPAPAPAQTEEATPAIATNDKAGAAPDGVVIAVLGDTTFVDGVTHLVTHALTEAVPALIGAAVDLHLRADDNELVRRINEYLDANLPDLVKLSMPASEIEVIQPVEFERPKPIVDDRQVAADTAAHEIARTQARSEAMIESRGRFAALFDGAPDSGAIDLTDVRAAKMLIDDGLGFSLDFAQPVPIEQLKLVDGDVMLAGPAVAIGGDMPEQFTAKGVVLLLQCEEGFVGLRCELAHPILVGGGMNALLGENSLLFRARR